MLFLWVVSAGLYAQEFKKTYVNAKEEDVKIIKSPVGMPGRAIYNKFIQKTENEKCHIDRCYNCIKTCNVATTPYCITKALINAVKGNINEGLVFCGSNVDKVKGESSQIVKTTAEKKSPKTGN